MAVISYLQCCTEQNAERLKKNAQRLQKREMERL